MIYKPFLFLLYFLAPLLIKTNFENPLAICLIEEEFNIFQNMRKLTTIQKKRGERGSDGSSDFCKCSQEEKASSRGAEGCEVDKQMDF